MARSRAERLSWTSAAEAEIRVWEKLIRRRGGAKSSAGNAAGAANPSGAPA
jgi:hypothetical protein